MPPRIKALLKRYLPAGIFLTMSNAYERKKQPDHVRRSLLSEGARLCVEQGVAGMKLQAVATAAGVTKGGLLHHFPNKQQLVAAIFDRLLEKFDADIERAMAADPNQRGCFTRAYVTATLDLVGTADFIEWQALMMAMLTEAALKRKWTDWMRRHLNTHDEAGADLELARFAADGFWLAAMMGDDDTLAERREMLRQRLYKLTGLS